MSKTSRRAVLAGAATNNVVQLPEKHSAIGETYDSGLELVKRRPSAARP